MAQITSIYALRRLQQQTSQNVAAAGLLAGLCFNEGPDQWLFFSQAFWNTQTQRIGSLWKVESETKIAHSICKHVPDVIYRRIHVVALPRR